MHEELNVSFRAGMGCAALCIEAEKDHALAGGGGIVCRFRTLPEYLYVCKKEFTWRFGLAGAVAFSGADEGCRGVIAVALRMVPMDLCQVWIKGEQKPNGRKIENHFPGWPQ